MNECGNVECRSVCDEMSEYKQPCDVCPINEAFKKLAHYEDLEEQGRLIELPCKVGDEEAEAELKKLKEGAE